MTVSGYDKQYVPAVDIRVLDTPENSWKIISSFTTARAAITVVSTNCDSILIIGGFTHGVGISEPRAHSTSTVEKGTIRLCCTQKAADIHNTKLYTKLHCSYPLANYIVSYKLFTSYTIVINCNIIIFIGYIEQLAICIHI